MEGRERKAEERRLCPAGCGFYGSPATRGLCSLCHQLFGPHAPPPPPPTVPMPSVHSADVQEKGMDKPPLPLAVEPQSEDNLPDPWEVKQDDTDDGSLPTKDSTTTPATPDPAASTEEKKSGKSRCKICRKKLGLTGFDCRCGGMFCSIHRYSDKHDCSFDYRQLGAAEIRKNNPVVVSDKIKKL